MRQLPYRLLYIDVRACVAERWRGCSLNSKRKGPLGLKHLHGCMHSLGFPAAPCGAIAQRPAHMHTCPPGDAW